MERSRQKSEHVCCVDEYEHNRATESVYCTRLDQWVAMNYCKNVCGKFRRMEAQLR